MKVLFCLWLEWPSTFIVTTSCAIWGRLERRSIGSHKVGRPEPDQNQSNTSQCQWTSTFSPGGMFEFVSGANFFGEIVEWCGYAFATWTFPAFAFAFFTICSIAPRALHHHRYCLELVLVTPTTTTSSSFITCLPCILSCRDYQQRFEDYPHSRTAIIPFILWEQDFRKHGNRSCNSGTCDQVVDYDDTSSASIIYLQAGS